MGILCLRPDLQNYFMIILRFSRFTSTRMLRHCLLSSERFYLSSLDEACFGLLELEIVTVHVHTTLWELIRSLLFALMFFSILLFN